MKQLFLFTLLLVAATSCQINVMQPDDSNAVVPDANARIARKLSIGGLDGKTVYAEERYEYNAKGQLTKISRLYRSASGKLELNNYDEYAYTGEQLQQTTSYYLQQGKPFVSSLRRYEYPTDHSVIENTFAVNNQSQATMLTGRTETTLEQGRKVRMVSYYQSGETMTKSYEIAYRYNAGRLVAEENINPNGSLRTTFRYVYKGRTATVQEFMGSRSESISEQAFQYDNRGRLIRSEVTKMNPLYCVAFTLGSATVYEYVD